MRGTDLVSVEKHMQLVYFGNVTFWINHSRSYSLLTTVSIYRSVVGITISWLVIKDSYGSFCSSPFTFSEGRFICKK